MAGEPECIWDLKATLGEGPLWSVSDKALWFTDIKQQKIHRISPEGEKRSWDAPAQPGFIVPVAGGGYVVGLQTGLHRFDPGTGGFERLTPVEPDKPGNRLNDCCVAPDGTLWFGSMDDGETDESGAVYRLGPDAKPGMAGGQCCITNGPAVSPDGRILYHVNTLARRIEAWDIGAEGELSNGRLFAEIAPEHGYPDGPTVDADGCIWIGLWGGWSARRYSPAGEILEEVRFPVANITKIALGGDDLRTAYATTASKGLSEAERADQPLAGGLFSFRVETPGLACPGINIGR